MPAGKVEFHNAYWRNEQLQAGQDSFEGVTVELDIDNTGDADGEKLEINISMPDTGMVSLPWDELVAAVTWLRAYEGRGDDAVPEA